MSDIEVTKIDPDESMSLLRLLHCWQKTFKSGLSWLIESRSESEAEVVGRLVGDDEGAEAISGAQNVRKS